MKASEAIQNRQVDVFSYTDSEPTALSEIIYKFLIELKTPLILRKPCPAWDSYMADISKGLFLGNQ